MSLAGRAGAPPCLTPPGPSLGDLRVVALCEFLPHASCGGSDHVAWQVHRRLAAWGAQVTLVCSSPSGVPLVDDMVDDVHIVSARASDLGRFIHAEAILSARLFTIIPRAVRTMSPTVIHVNSLHFQSSALGALTAWRRSLPLVTTAHLAGTQQLSRPLRDLVSAYDHTVGRLILSKSANVIAVSDSVREHLRQLHVSDTKITVIPNGVDTERFYPKLDRSESRRPTRLAFVGRLVSNKGPDLFVDALSELARREVPFEAVVIGDGPCRARMELAIHAAGIGERVSFTGRVSNVDERLRDVDILVRPSLTEGMPLAVLEALASGVCVVASDVDGTRDIIQHGHNGLLFPPGDCDALVSSLTSAIRDRRLRLRLVATGAERARAHSWDATARATAHVLQSAAQAVPA